MYSVLASGFYLTICVSLHGRTFKIVQAAFEIKKLSTLLLAIPLASFAAAAHRNCPTTFHNGSFIKVSPAKTKNLTNWLILDMFITKRVSIIIPSPPQFFWALAKGRFSSLSLFKEFLDRTSWMTHDEPLFWRDVEVYNLTKQLSSSFGKLFFFTTSVDFAQLMMYLSHTYRVNYKKNCRRN